jgi:hypothetical protein
MRVIVLNQNNLVPDGQNNKLVYKFPNSVLFKNNSIAVSSVSMYYSWFNITSAYNNNTFTYTWVVGGTTNTYTITIPDGLYEITQLNALLQYNFIANGTYLIDSSGKNAYYGEFILNPTRYAVQINTYSVPTALPTGYTAPSNWVGGFNTATPPVAIGFPTQTFNPSITIPANLNVILGYTAGFQTNQNTNNAYTPPANSQYVSKNGAGTLSYLSTSSPNLQPNSSIYFAVSNINNPYSLPSSIIYSLVPTGAVGTLIAERPPQFMWNRMIDGTYNELRLTFLGTDLQPIKINDPQMTILLTIKDGDEMGGK